MSGPVTGLDHDAALRAAAGYLDVADGLDAAAEDLRTALAGLRLGGDAVGAALAARHGPSAAGLAHAVPALAEAVRGLHLGVVTGAAALTAADADVAGTVAHVVRTER